MFFENGIKGFFNKLLVVSMVGVGSSAYAETIIYQAEDQTWSQAVFETTHAGFIGTGYVNTNNTGGSYIEFTVTVPAAGQYDFSYRYANGSTSARPIDLSINGEFKLPQLTGASTGNWANWASESFSVNLVAGSNSVRLISAGSNGAPNIDALNVTINAASQELYQAEDQTWSQAVFEAIHSGFTGSGYVNTNNIAGSYIEFTVAVPSAGSYPIAIQYANGATGARLGDIAINGEFKLPVFNFNSTNNWTNWSSETLNLSLESGTNTIRVIGQGNQGLPNIDALTVSITQ